MSEVRRPEYPEHELLENPNDYQERVVEFAKRSVVYMDHLESQHAADLREIKKLRERLNTDRQQLEAMAERMADLLFPPPQEEKR